MMMRWLPSWMRNITIVIGMPCLVAGLMLLGAIVFQALLYLYYGQPLFDNTALPGADGVEALAGYPSIVRWPAELVARAWHMWSVEAPKAVTVLVLGSGVGWVWAVWARVHASRQLLAHLDKCLESSKGA